MLQGAIGVQLAKRHIGRMVGNSDAGTGRRENSIFVEFSFRLRTEIHYVRTRLPYEEVTFMDGYARAMIREEAPPPSKIKLCSQTLAFFILVPPSNR